MDFKKLLLGFVVAGIILGVAVHFYYRSQFKSQARNFIETPAANATASIEDISQPKDEKQVAAAKQKQENHANDQQAIKELTDKIKANPQEPMYFYKRALYYYATQQYSQAIDDLNEVIKLNPNSANSYYFRGLNYAARLEYKNAIADYTAALRIKHDDPIFLNSRALAEVEDGNTQAAWEDYSLAIRKQPDYEHAHYNLGTLYERQKKFPEAKAEYDLAIKYFKPDYDPNAAKAAEVPAANSANAAPTTGQAATTTAPSTTAQGTTTPATATAPAATATTSNTAMPSLVSQSDDMMRLLETYYRRAIVNYELQDYNAALADISFVIEKNPKDAKAYKLRAVVYGKLGNTAAAAMDDTKAQDLSISNMLQQ